MASSKMRVLERQMTRREERITAPDTSGGIGGVIEQLIADEVANRVGEAVEKTNNQRLDRLFKPPAPKYTSFDQIPPTPRAPKPRTPLSSKIYRDGANKMTLVEINGPAGIAKYKAVRDGAGILLGWEEVEVSPVLPALDIDYKGEARKFQPGTAR